MNDNPLSDAIAVVGMSGRFPGAATLDAYWDNLRDGICSITDFTLEEALADGADPAEVSRPDYVPAKGLLADADRFEAELFGFNPREAAVLDPQHRLLLETAWKALEDAGYDPRAVPETTGVYVGGGLTEHAVAAQGDFRLAEERGVMQVKLLTDKDYLASWISYRLGLRGPSMVVQTACSTSLTAVHLAVQSLLLGECSLALAGGVAVDNLARRGYLYYEGGVASPDGRCRPFDEQSAGTLGGNGVGLVVLRRYEDALRDGDRVYAVIRGSAVTNDGAAKVGFTAPSPEGQQAVLAEAMAAAGVSPRDLQYIEMHGSGTALGDRIEVGAATAAFGAEPGETAWCGIGSVKSNIGHLDAAAGIAGLLKVVLMLRRRSLVPTANFQRPNPELELEKTPFYVVDRTAEWPRPEGARRRAGVTSVGLGGTNVHVVLEEAPDQPAPDTQAQTTQLLPLSARTERSLLGAAEALSRHLAEPATVPLADVAHTLQSGRSALGVRGCVVARTAVEAAEELRLLAGSGRTRTVCSPGAPVFLLSGQGGHYPGMGADLYRAYPAFRDAFDACAQRLTERHGIDPRSWLPGAAPTGDDAGSTAYWQPALFSLEYAAARLWAGWGVTPAAVVGHSLGEYPAAVLAGVFTLDEALDLVVTRARLMAGTAPGRMVAVALAEAELLPLLEGHGNVALAAVNGPAACVLSGPVEDVDRITAELAARRIGARPLATGHAFHSPAMDEILDAFEAEVAGIGPRRPAGPFVSTVTGGTADPARVATAAYWRDQLRLPVRFADAVAAAGELTDGPLLELGPGNALTGQARRVLPGRPAHATLAEDTEQARTLRALGELWTSGQQVNWPAVTGPDVRRAHLPGYVFDGAPRGALTRTVAQPAAPVAPSVPTQTLAGSEPAVQSPAAQSPIVPTPQDSVRDRIAELLMESLGIESDAGLDRSFFDAGGDSLAAVHLAGKLRDSLEIEIPIALLLEQITLRELIDRIAETRESRDSDGLIDSLLSEIESGG
ncbi:beta-ketoacyl synthase N-terminal-like domain-containing protein [Kitasatospora sp. GP82]|uniref:type I polyketide synthase n=1 Tax=Kitasatospora sp. GP82 TaxID=3035089 RepID=UPI0024734A04|nr:beta-ketoacyl synthase N-terminal-like domain-containing protein [Kitasatospora sp. GP82]MDH6128766.1 acyl transferase domain-containing protein [Kitasatospora sp. GP82]